MFTHPIIQILTAIFAIILVVGVGVYEMKDFQKEVEAYKLACNLSLQYDIEIVELGYGPFNCTAFDYQGGLYGLQ